MSASSPANFLMNWSTETSAHPPIVEIPLADIREARTLMLVATGQPTKTG